MGYGRGMYRMRYGCSDSIFIYRREREREQEQLLTDGAIDLCGDICKVVGGKGWEAGGAVDY